MSPAPPPASRTQHWLWPLLLLLGSVTLAIAWLMVALATGSQAGWMAIAAAAEAAWMLRLGTLPGGRPRITVAMLATLLIALAANWGIAAAYIGGPMGLAPWESALRLGPHLAWTLIGLANGTAEILWLLAGLVAAWWLAR
ncbi:MULTISPECIES: hypothetical protein [Stenotrophomonas]|uniref:Membrane protein n=1 Tax=Stenotrophomonas nitritireducens TaxID=83617 RepID=A0ABR5NM14_9GAMM|nr:MULTISPECIES: hypothetical protein [Stenotrophomonas]KQN95712.1 hypothetical protein ASF01_15115 [Stenotrophomonas sp. Leaf70]KRG59101.1 membrane protein [Stenotrophomonas nitritireducens]MBN8793640.1 hypothetical protein [Stenotrophomonas nitritireducens]MBN8797358.1 hypothetical protein [Stenotrophomonas nitritireducens]